MALASDGGSAAAYYWVPVNTDDAYVLGRKSGAGFVDADSGEAIDAVAAADCYAVASPAAARAVVADMVQMHEVNRASILHVLRARYGSGDIYTAMGSVLVATNPFERLDAVYARATLGRFVDPQTPDEDLEPHIWFTARRAYRALVSHGVGQSLIVSGESGSGKTETTKKALEYVAAASATRGDGGGGGGAVSAKVLSASPILEAFGNAKTLRNDNSSRFGKYLEVVLDGGGRVVGAKTTNYLLEKSRVVRQAPGERGYHAFYHCVAGRAEHPTAAVSAAALGALWASARAEIFAYARGGGCVEIPALDVDAARLGRALVTRTISAGGRGSINVVVLAAGAAGDARDALAKALYAKLFDWAVDRVNREMEAPAGEAKTIGVLDIFGFEIFESNSFEQLCINLTNEQLQNKFNRDIFELELRLYADEGVPCDGVEYKDNSDVIALLGDVLAMLDEEARLPRGSAKSWSSKVGKKHEKHARLHVDKRAAGEAFGVVHYAGLVTYDVDQFLVKNVDQLSGDLSSCVAGSSHERTAALLTWNDAPAAAARARRPGLRRREQDDRVKPNMEKVRRVFRSPVVLEQLTYAGVFETVTIQQSGWPFRSPHERFATRYFVLDLKNAAALRRLGPSGHARRSSRAAGDRCFGEAQVAFGKTVVFYRATAASRLEALRAAAHAKAVLSVAAVAKRAGVEDEAPPGSAAATLEGARGAAAEIRELRPAVAEAHAVAAASVAFLHGFLPAAFEASPSGDAVLKALEEGERLAGILEALVAKDDAAAHYDDLERALKAVDAVADPDAAGRAAERRRAARAQVRGVRDLMVAKRCLERGVAERSKADLEEGLGALARLRASGAVSADFCAAEERAAEACKDAVFAEVAAVVPPIRKRRARAPAPSRWTAARSTRPRCGPRSRPRSALRRRARRRRARAGSPSATPSRTRARASWSAAATGPWAPSTRSSARSRPAAAATTPRRRAELEALRCAAEDDAAADEIARALAAGAVAGVDALRRAVSAFRAPIRRSPAAPAKQASWLDAAEAELGVAPRLGRRGPEAGLAAAMAAGAAHLSARSATGRRTRRGSPRRSRRSTAAARRRASRRSRSRRRARRSRALAKGDYDALEDAGLHFDAVVVAREAGVHGDGGGDGVVDMAVLGAEMDCLRVEVLNVRAREACEAVAATPRVVGVPGAVDGSRLDPVAERGAGRRGKKVSAVTGGASRDVEDAYELAVALGDLRAKAHADDWDAILTKGVLDVDSAEVALLRDEASDRRDRAAALAALAEGRPRGAVGSLDVGAVDDAPLRALDGGRRSPATVQLYEIVLEVAGFRATLKAGDVDLDEAALRQAAAACDVLAESERVKIHADRLRVGPACFDAAVAARDECALLRRCAALRRVARELAAAVVAGPALGAPGALDLATLAAAGRVAGAPGNVDLADCDAEGLRPALDHARRWAATCATPSARRCLATAEALFDARSAALAGRWPDVAAAARRRPRRSRGGDRRRARRGGRAGVGGGDDDDDDAPGAFRATLAAEVDLVELELEERRVGRVRARELQRAAVSAASRPSCAVPGPVRAARRGAPVRRRRAAVGERSLRALKRPSPAARDAFGALADDALDAAVPVARPALDVADALAHVWALEAAGPLPGALAAELGEADAAVCEAVALAEIAGALVAPADAAMGVTAKIDRALAAATRAGKECFHFASP
ncbi:hypothetical protein JL722_14741 [Aureococcus anophagefferens]|nr:hypothetical protein JL722_14741 [Aureococcus anophagefferens]